MTRKNRLTRVLALVLCLCLTVPYLPVPGHAEGCGHVHGEACYQEVTQCVHTHGEDCWSDPEARENGEEPDACAHVCNEDTGCVTKELNCSHVHDDTCGEQLQVEPEPEPEEPEPEEPKPEEPKQEEPKKEEPQEPKNEEPKQEEENQPLVISQWEWVDEEEVLDPETGVLCLSSEEPILFEQVAELLPKAILADVGEGSQTVLLDHWDPKDYPQETGANSGGYRLEATLPEGYTLAEDAAPLTLHLEFAQAQALAECGHENVNMDTGMCKDCTAQVYEAKIGDTGYATLEEALDAAQEMDTACTVTLLCDVSESCKTIESGTITLDLNGKKWDLFHDSLIVDGGDLTLTTSIPNGKISSSNGGHISLKKGTLTINGGEYEIAKTLCCIGTDGGSLRISGGTFISRESAALSIGIDTHVELSGGSFSGVNGMVVADDCSAAELLAAGYAFYSDAEGSNIVDASGETLFGTVYVLRNHPSHTFDAATCKCVCGLYNHSINMDTGKCDICKTQIYVAKIDMAGYKTLEGAILAAEKIDGCTVTMLLDTEVIGYRGLNLNITLDLNGKEITTENNTGSFMLKSGILKIVDNSVEKTGQIGSLNHKFLLTTFNTGKISVYGGSFLNTYIAGSVTFYGGILENASLDQKLLDYLAPGRAAYSDADRKKVADASALTGTITGTYYILPHTDIYDPAIDQCPCGRKLLQVTTVAPKAAENLTYNGQAQNLVTPGTVTGGKLMYSLAENGTYTETVPTGKKADTYTVWYYVLGTPGEYYNTQKQSLTVTVGKKDLTPVVTIQDQDFDGTKEVKHFTVALEGKEDGDELTYTLGTLEFDAAIPGTRTASLTGTPQLKGKDAGNYNLKAPAGLTGKIKATSRYLEVPDSLPNTDTVTVDGEEYPVKTEGGKRYVMLPDTGSLLTVYTYQTNADNKTYPDTMRVFAIDRQDTGSTLTEIPEFENLLTYEGCSIRLNGTKGIRMITSIDQAKKKALVNSNLAGYTLVEYGTVITRESTLGGKTLNLGTGKSNYAYSKANKKDPVFKTANGRIQYTNVLVNFQPADYQTELVLRPYIKLRDAAGNEVVLYGGTVTRSIYYIAQQNLGDYKPGSAGHKYLQEILGQK